MRSYQELMEVIKTQKDPAYAKRAKRDLIKLRQEREDKKAEAKKNQEAKDDARARLADREKERSAEKQQRRPPAVPESQKKQKFKSDRQEPKKSSKPDISKRRDGKPSGQLKPVEINNPPRRDGKPSGQLKPVEINDPKGNVAAAVRAKKASQDENNRKGKKWWKVWEEMQLVEAMDGTQEKNRRVKQMAKPKPGAPVGGTSSTISAAKPSNTMKRPSSFGAKPTTTNTKGPNMSPEVAVARTKKTQAAPKGPAMNSDVEAARRRRKAQEANVRPAASANSDVAAARAKRKEGEKNRLADAGGSTLKTGQQGPKTRTRAVNDQRDAQVRAERERLNKPTAQAPRRPGQAEAERKAREGRIKGIEKKKTDKQMAKLGRDKAGPGGQLKSMAGGDMFIRDKKTDTQGTRDRKSSMRNKARGDFTKKKVQQTGSAVGSATKSFGKFVGSTVKDTTKDKVGDSKASQVQGSSEIIRGSRL